MLNIWVSLSHRTCHGLNILTRSTKSNNTLKFNKRTIQTNSGKLKEIAYKTYVRLLTEYAASVWDPWQKKYIYQLVMIQHVALRYIFVLLATDAQADLSRRWAHSHFGDFVMSRLKTNKKSVRPAKTQISLVIHPV